MASKFMLLFAILSLFISSCRIVSVSASSSPVICFTFDDQHEGVFEVALPLMQTYGYRGTCFVNTGKLGMPSYMTQAELIELFTEYDWEIGGHSLTHESLVNIDYPEAQYAIATDYENLQTWNVNPRSFALPYGDCPQEYYTIIADYYRNIRGSNDSAMHTPLNRLGLGYFPMQSGWNATMVKNRIERGIADHEDLIIIGFHQIDGTNDPYGTNCTSDVLEDILEYVDSLGLVVLPLDEAVETLSIRA